MPQYLDQMEVLLKEDNVDAVQAIMNGTFYGLGRLRDHMKKLGMVGQCSYCCTGQP
ncbi:MAG: hypothetical protein GYA52_12525 [Chloroflexi bacterium]|jgi:hypothetical protein|nr:hypothetical protein [Chloroflexota bacterium]